MGCGVDHLSLRFIFYVASFALRNNLGFATWEIISFFLFNKSKTCLFCVCFYVFFHGCFCCLQGLFQNLLAGLSPKTAQTKLTNCLRSTQREIGWISTQHNSNTLYKNSKKKRSEIKMRTGNTMVFWICSGPRSLGKELSFVGLTGKYAACDHKSGQ